MTSRASLCSPHAEYYAAGILHLFFVVWLEQFLIARATSRDRCNLYWSRQSAWNESWVISPPPTSRVRAGFETQHRAAPSSRVHG